MFAPRPSGPNGPSVKTEPAADQIASGGASPRPLPPGLDPTPVAASARSDRVRRWMKG